MFPQKYKILVRKFHITVNKMLKMGHANWFLHIFFYSVTGILKADNMSILSIKHTQLISEGVDCPTPHLTSPSTEDIYLI